MCGRSCALRQWLELEHAPLAQISAQGTGEYNDAYEFVYPCFTSRLQFVTPQTTVYRLLYKAPSAAWQHQRQYAALSTYVAAFLQHVFTRLLTLPATYLGDHQDGVDTNMAS